MLETIEEGKALIRIDGPSGGSMTYEVLLPAYTAARLGGSIGQAIALSTLYYIESQAQGATMIPRLAGFLSAEDQRFFELFTTCKGIGYRKALRAMAVDVARLATAISDRDVAMLQTLPEIGRRTAETIVATLRGKVDRFVTATAFAPAGQSGGEPGGDSESPSSTTARQALDVLIQLGENRVQAIDWIDRVLHDQESAPGDVQQLVAGVYRLKSHS